MGIFRQFPYSNFHDMNMDEIIKIVKQLADEWAAYQAQWSDLYTDTQQALTDFKAYVENYFNTLDLNDETEEALRRMLNSGELDDIIRTQLSPVVTAWLQQHVTLPEGVVIDSSLSIAGAAADAKATGDAIKDLSNDLIYRFNAINRISHGYYLYGPSDSTSQGNLRANANYDVTDFIPVYEGMKLSITGTGFGNISVCFAYDENHAPIDNVLFETTAGAWKRYNNEEITIGSGISYVRCSFIIEGGRTYSIYTDYDGNKYIENHKKINEAWIPMYSDDLVVGRLTGGQSETTPSITNTTDANHIYRISSPYIITLPFGEKTKIMVKMKNTNYRVAFRFGNYSNHMDMVTGYYSDGEIIDVDALSRTQYTPHPNYYAITMGLPIFGRNPDYTTSTAKQLTADDIAEAGLQLFAINPESDVEDCNDEACNMIASARLDNITYAPASARKTPYNTKPVIIHTSDAHGDENRIKRFFDFGEVINADLAVMTGDIVTYNPNSGFGWFHKLANNYAGKIGICVGNHDVYLAGQTDNDVYNSMFAPIADKIGLTTGKTFYYKDYAALKIRIISVNIYQYDGRDTVLTRPFSHFTAEQITWLINTLQNTPNDYGVIILEHSPQRSVNNAAVSGKTEFYQASNNRSWDNINNHVNGAPIYDIVDAFIGRTTINKTYTQAGEPATLTVSADFTNVNNSIEFIAFMNGHIHMDSVCYVPDTTHKQLCLNVSQTLPAYGGEYYSYLADGSDIGRSFKSSAQDSFNAYVIDRESKTVKIIRVGSNRVYTDNSKREYMEIAYAD